MLAFLLIPVVFWIAFLVLLGYTIYAVENESTFGATCATVAASALGINYFGSFSAALDAIIANPLIVVIAFVSYLILGTLWSRFKWELHVRDKANKINEEIKIQGRDAAAQNFSGYRMPKIEILNTNFACLAPKAAENKKKITTWIILCVPSFVWFIVNDPIRRAANEIFTCVKDHFQKASDRVFSNAFKIKE